MDPDYLEFFLTIGITGVIGIIICYFINKL